jgi:hypothetical protein
MAPPRGHKKLLAVLLVILAIAVTLILGLAFRALQASGSTTGPQTGLAESSVLSHSPQRPRQPSTVASKQDEDVDTIHRLAVSRARALDGPIHVGLVKRTREHFLDQPLDQDELLQLIQIGRKQFNK